MGSDEVLRIKDRYTRRGKISKDRYSIMNPEVLLSIQEKERYFVKWIKLINRDISNTKILEIGSGFGDNLLEFIRLGFTPSNIIGNELIKERLEISRQKLPSAVTLFQGDANKLGIEDESIDVVFQSLVFSSILDEKFKKELAGNMWRWVKIGGGVLWYDFIYDNPFNKDVKSIKLKEVEKLFPNKPTRIWKITLAPPISRSLVKLHPGLIKVFNIFPFLKTHILCWIPK